MKGRAVAVDSSTEWGSIALFEDGEFLDGGSEWLTDRQGEAIVSKLDVALKEKGWTPSDVRTWVVGVGPGSFTGIRIAVATIKGIALATGADVIPVGSLDALPMGLQVSPETVVVSALPAMKEELFLQAILDGKRLWGPFHLGIQHISDHLAPHAGSLVVVGGGADLVERWTFDPPPDLRTSPPHDRPRAASLGAFALHLSPVSLDEIEPLYLRPADVTTPKT